MNKRTKTALRRWCLYGWTFAKWTMAASAIGVVCGLIGTMFHFGVHEVTAFRGTHPWVLYLLPLAGFVIVSFYKLTETDGLGTDDIIDAVHEGKRLPILLLPAIFFGTVLTHLCGGSAGREGAALQMGGTIGQCMGRTFRLDDRDLRVATLAGMAAFFSALFGTPLAATVFAIMVISIGVLYHVALYPSLLAALVAYGVSVRLGVEPTRFTVAVPDQSVGMFVRVAALGVLCALVSILFCKVLHTAPKLYAKYFPNPLLRAAVGGALVLALTLLVGSQDYNGAGDGVIRRMLAGETIPEAFLMKILFTALTLGAGFRGGEIVPVLFTGAAFGTTVGPLLGLPHGFGGALGMAAVFCGATNCPMTALMLAFELFGGESLTLYAVCCGVAYMLSGYYGLYSEQKIVYSKFRTEWIDKKAK